jgi:hypothetical protein
MSNLLHHDFKWKDYERRARWARDGFETPIGVCPSAEKYQTGPTESLVFFAVVAQLAYSHQHFRESPDRHLAPDAPSDAKCKYSKRMMSPCVCEKAARSS